LRKFRFEQLQTRTQSRNSSKVTETALGLTKAQQTPEMLVKSLSMRK
jgi:hypothetical protein